MLAAILGAGLLVGCSDDSTPPSGPSATPTAAPTATPTAVPTVVPPTAVPLSTTPAPPFQANTLPDTEQPGGGLLGLKAVRAARQAGYDRVVFELAGAPDGRPGWRVEYVAQPTSDGSGNPVTVAGPAYLRVVINGVGYPPDTGVPQPSVKRFSPAGTAVVREVVLDGVFEGYYTSFVGLRAKEPFRVFRLADPPRVVVDVRHS